MERQPASLRIGKRELAAMLVGVLLYVGASWVTNFATLGFGAESALAGTIRPGVAVPIFCGLVFGPIVGFVVGFFGNLLLDFIAGYVTLPPLGASPATIVTSLQLNWEFGNGLMGLIPGIAAMFHRRYVTRRELVRAVGISFVAIIVGIGLAATLDPLLFPASYANVSSVWDVVLWEQFIPITLTNCINATVIVPIVLFNYERLDLRSRDSLRSGLMRRILLTIVISAAVPITLLTIFLFQANLSGGSSSTGGGTLVIVQLTFTIGLTAVFIVTNAALMAQSMTRPLLRLITAAQAMECGHLTAQEAAELKDIHGNDEIAQLSKMFGTMAQEVIQREENLRKHVQELQIIIDEQKRSDQVKEIVETDFFRDLQQKAHAMRRRGKSAPADAVQE